MTTIVQATGSEIVSVQGGSVSYVGSFDATAIDQDVTQNGVISIPALRLFWIRSLFVSAGIDFIHLTDSQMAYGTAAYRWACVVAYLELSMASDPVACDTTSDKYEASRTAWLNQIAFARSMVCRNLQAIGLTDSQYCQPSVRWSELFTTNYITRK